MEEYPIQLIDIGVKELKISTEPPPQYGEDIDVNLFTLGVGHTDFDEENQRINIGLRFEYDQENAEKAESSNLTELAVEIIGHFAIDTDNFPQDKIEHWAHNNAPYILIPYLREHIYSLTQKSGFKPLIIPLFKVPTLNIDNSTNNNQT